MAADFRTPPAEMEAEEALLGALQIDREAIGRVAGFLNEADFYRERHGAIYGAIRALCDRGDPGDFVTLCAELERTGKLQQVGGAAYLAGLTNATPSAAFAEHYGRLIQRAAQRRRLIAVAGQLARDAYDEPDPAAIIERTESALYEVRRGQVAGKLIPPQERVSRAWSRYEAAGRGEQPGMDYGLIDLDRLTGGTHRGELVIVAGRPSMGKTSMMQSVAESQAMSGRLILFCSAEMPETQLTDRYFAAELGTTVHRLEAGQLTEEHWNALASKIGRAREGLPWVYDDADMTTTTIRSAATEMRSKAGLDAVYVDYIQCLHDRVREGETERVTLISRNLKALARALDVPVLASSQLNRQCEFRADKQPMLSDLRESGSLEQDADVVLLLFRPSYYFTPQQWHDAAKDEPYENACKVMVAKQRNGPRGVHVWLRFDPHTVRFSALERFHVG